MDDYVPVSIKGVNFQKTTVDWDHIGGMFEAKKTLVETIERPTKYSFLYDNFPLRNRSGILLYGPPGCGKTVLACAIGIFYV